MGHRHHPGNCRHRRLNRSNRLNCLSVRSNRRRHHYPAAGAGAYLRRHPKIRRMSRSNHRSIHRSIHRWSHRWNHRWSRRSIHHWNHHSSPLEGLAYHRQTGPASRPHHPMILRYPCRRR
jgi:hypothetical protein